MTLGAEAAGDGMARASVRLDRTLGEWLEALVAEGHYESMNEVAREGCRRIVMNPSRLWSIDRPWGRGTYKRPTFRMPPKLLTQVNDLEREGWEASAGEIVRVGIGLVADQQLESATLSNGAGGRGGRPVFDPDSGRLGYCPACPGQLRFDHESRVIGCSRCGRRWRPG